MFKNTGKQIKIWAIVLCIIGLGLSIYWGFYFASLNDGKSLLSDLYRNLALFFLVVGPALAWISGLVLYGFGQLVENSDKLANGVGKDEAEVLTTNAAIVAPMSSNITNNANSNAYSFACPKCGKQLSISKGSEDADFPEACRCPYCLEQIDLRRYRKN